VADLVERFLDAKQLQGGIDLRRYYAKHLKRFNHGFGDAPAEMVRPTHLQTVKDEMLGAGYAPKTVNHDVIAVRSMFDWASGLELISAVNMKGVKVLSLGPPPDKSMPIERVLSMIAKATHPLKAWLALNYLALMRPSEVVRVAHKQGTWVETGVFRLDKGKTDLKATLPRHVCFSDEALSWIDACDPKWSRLDCYSAAVRRVCGPGGPHPLRHSAATHLSQLGEERAAIDLLLGHAPPRVSLTYARINWQPLRRTASRLTLQPAVG